MNTLLKNSLRNKSTFGKYTLAQKSLAMVATSLLMVLTSLVMVSTSLGMVGTPEALLWGPQRRLLHRRATRDWKSESVTYLPTNLPTYQLTWVGARDTCVSKNFLLVTGPTHQQRVLLALSL